jgi:hypothetical protein
LLDADGKMNAGYDWYASDCPVEVGLDPEVEEGQKSNLKCGDAIKNVVRTDDQLTGMTLKLSMGCRNPEIEFLIAGGVGMVTYDSSSPPCSIGYCPPTLAQQPNAHPFEMRIFRSEKQGSNDVGYEQIHIYQCLPAFVTIGGNQEEYSTQEWTIACVENANYSPAKPVYCWSIVNTIPV